MQTVDHHTSSKSTYNSYDNFTDMSTLWSSLRNVYLSFSVVYRSWQIHTRKITAKQWRADVFKSAHHGQFSCTPPVWLAVVSHSDFAFVWQMFFLRKIERDCTKLVTSKYDLSWLHMNNCHLIIFLQSYLINK